MLASVLQESQRRQLLYELNYAIHRTPREEIQQWGYRIPNILATVLIRRVKSIGRLAKFISELILGEGKVLIDAIWDNRVLEHLANRGKVAKDVFLEAINKTKIVIEEFSSSVALNPKREAPKLAAALFGFAVGSGGLDGDGGVPDLDFLGGIGAHRSIFTHSIIAGAVIETLLISVSDLAQTVHRHLPNEHEPIWEELVDGGEKILLTLAIGVSAGITYHFGVDATLDGEGTFKDLPISVSQDAHQVIIAGNALVEGTDTFQRSREKIKSERTVEKMLFETFKEAKTVARQERSSKITRNPNGRGFIVTKKKK